MRYLDKLFNSRLTPGNQVQAEAGPWTRLERFLIIGSESGTYCVTDKSLTTENAAATRECLKMDGQGVVDTIVDISASGRAARIEPALFVLAMAASPAFANAKTNAAALSALSLVARTAGQLCSFAAMVEGLRGWGRGLRSAVADWYLTQPVKELAHQMLKHPERAGWSHRDLLRVAHPKAATPEQNALFRWAVDNEIGDLAPVELRQVYGFELVKRASADVEVARLIEEYRLTLEMIPSRWTSSAAVWQSLLADMPYEVLVRHLGELTAIGCVAPHSEATALVVARLIDRHKIERSKIHPIALFAAGIAYRHGGGTQGRLRWAPVTAVADALDEAFYLALANVQPAGQRIYVAIDASDSMQDSVCNGTAFLTPAMASAAMAMVFAHAEPSCMLSAFDDEIRHIDMDRKVRLDAACSAIAAGSRHSNASLPFSDALDRGLEVDAFVLMTGSATWAGKENPAQAFAHYRRESGVASKLVVIAMAAGEMSITDPEDVLQMGVCGFDASVPGVVAGFVS